MDVFLSTALKCVGFSNEHQGFIRETKFTGVVARLLK